MTSAGGRSKVPTSRAKTREKWGTRNKVKIPTLSQKSREGWGTLRVVHWIVA